MQYRRRNHPSRRSQLGFVYIGRERALLGSNWNPRKIFPAGEDGTWFSSADLAASFQDSAGTSAAYQPGQGSVDPPVGLLLDKRLGIVRSANLITNGDFSGGVTAPWTATNSTLSVVAGKLRITNVGTFFGYAQQIVPTVVGQRYFVTGTRADGTASASLRAGTTAAGVEYFNTTGTGSTAVSFVATTTTAFICCINNTNTDTFTSDYDDIVVTTILGNHATQPTATSRAVLSGKENVLTATEQADLWNKGGVTVTPNAGTAPDGTVTADLVFPTLTGASRELYQSSVAATGVTYTHRLKIKSSGWRWIGLGGNGLAAQTVFFDVLNGVLGTQAAGFVGTITADPRGGSWYICTVTYTASVSSPNFDLVFADADNSVTATASGSNGVLVAEAQSNPGTTAARYQRVVDPSNYAAGFPLFDKLDGSDDGWTVPGGGGGTAGFFWCGSVRVLGGAGGSRSVWSDTGVNTGYRVRITSTNKLAIGAGDGVAFTSATTTDAVDVGGTYVLTVWDDGVNLNAQVGLGAVVQVARPVVLAGTTSHSIGKENGSSTLFAPVGLFEQIYRKNGGVNASDRLAAQRYCALKAGISI